MRAVFKPGRSEARLRALLAPTLLLPMLLFATLVACSDPGSADGSVAAPDAASGEKPSAEITAPDAREATVGMAARPGKTQDPAGATFVARAEASGGSSYEADTVRAIRYGMHEEYERVVLDLGTGDEPAASVPEWTIMSPTGDGLLRVTLPSISRTAVSDGTFGDGLLDGYYVVRAPEGGMFVDIFARKPFAYRVLGLSEPARLAVDFKPAGSPLKARPPAVGGDTVLVEPRAGARIGDPLTVCGYSRNFEASNFIALTDARGKLVVRRTVLGNDWTSTWGYFEATLDLPSFEGKGTLRVGTRSARDGTFEGVEVPVKGD
jgi:hypothetical protein